MNGDVNIAGLATSLALVAVAAAISLWQRLGLERQIVWASTRALVQLLLVGAALSLIIEPGSSLVWSWLWVVAMVAYAGDVARRPTRARTLPSGVSSHFCMISGELGRRWG
jgi:putative ABC transport system permease protein